jgi:hypothetical protein
MKRFFSNPLVALLAGACLRLLFVLRFPANSGDTVLYDQFAKNWLKLGKLAMDINGEPTPVDLRMPGYPAFLAVVYAVTGRTGESARLFVMLAQTVVDLATCVVIASLAALLAVLAGKQESKGQVFILGLWLSALCPFTANYVAVPLTEVWAVFFSAIAFLLLSVLAVKLSRRRRPFFVEERFLPKEPWQLAVAAGIAAGSGTLFRPETPLLLITAILVFGVILVWRRELARWIRISSLMGIACAAMLVPWIVRNAVTLHEFQPLAPRDATLPSEVDPKGFMAWEKTWMYRLRDAYLVTWKLNEEEIHLEDIPPSAFDTQQERDRVSAVLEKYNDDLTWNTEQDAEFAELAHERSARHPLRTYLWVPLRRASRIWFTPRVELLPVSGHAFPLAYQWEEDPVDQRITILFFLGNVVLVGLATCGVWKLWKHELARPAAALLIAYIVIRTVFLTTLEVPEPRYVLECFPAVIAFGAQVVWREPRQN